ncbi:MAG: DNA mismatch repair endonuclease MutL [Bacteroidota bacterium]
MNERHDESIVVLDDETIDKIAAGEVIERPASVVKELVENSLDAGASGITVEIHGAPGDFIRVSDNGSGMSRRDAKMAFRRHATSKIRTAADLHSVLTMGFRGEALASIAAVAKVELVTRRAGDVVGTRIVLEGGVVVLEEDAPSPVGTAVTCRDLFFNTPARRKFQRRPATEFDHVRDVVARLAMAWPDVRFRLVRGGRDVLPAQGTHGGDRRAAIASIYGTDLAKILLPVVAGTPRTSIEGFISPPDVTRASRDTQCVFVNGRPVAAPAVVRVIENAYGRRLPPGRYPAVFLWISTDPVSIDVNVHPAKREVRFSGGHDVFQLAAQAAASALRSTGAAPDLGRKLGHAPETGGATAGIARDSTGGYHAAPAAGLELAWTDGPGALYGGGLHPPDVQAGAGPSPSRGATARFQPRPHCSQPQVRDGARVGFAPLGVFMGTYILATDGDDLVIIDQHAAHERILYEAVLAGLSGSKPEVQTLIPTTLELSPRAASRVPAVLGELAKIGFLLEPFGPSSLLLRGVPSALGALRGTCDVARVVQESLEACCDDAERSGRDVKDLLARIAAEVACRAAVKAHRALEPPEIERLLADLARASDPYSCPHGRPTVLRISRAELERAFRRT